MKYPGGKGGAGVYQTIINLIPPHRVYIEAFAGGANVYERKAPAASSILIERDPRQADVLRSTIDARGDAGLAGVTVINADAICWLSSNRWVGDEFVYLDPPYVLSTRTKKAIYAHEMSDEDHHHLISALVAMSAGGVRFMLSGYRNAIYDDAARAEGWHRVDFQAMTRGGVRTESVWMNYEAPAVLADYGYVGRGFRERERIKRKVHRWVQRLQQLPALERAALLSAMQDLEAAGAGKNGDGRSRSIIAEMCEATR
ncbi:DNA adenine methylase [Pseudoduganella namucuonensis]|uniref:D12 class N6 adenine-specific DNA methyltransferase n=1 Tax=Pseudoduganella namucuonensis TaxID=1035707 RepID=A0A1I7LT13_9BURK|nr:DNA adenine methylase [Pseudoduganella namucuonensis]SFV12845.1 D12 class N6 adenine-specific DNA methyltransferase [Pseudoduganella namucuonensis]